MELASGNVAIINETQVKAGQKIGDLHVIEINMSHLVIDLGDGTVVYVRY